MMTFREYVFGIRFPRLRLLHPSWDDKFCIAWVGLLSLVALGYVFGFPNSHPLLSSMVNPWFKLLWIGTVPLGLYMRYCILKRDCI